MTQWRSDICSLRSSIKIVIFILYYIYYYNNIYNIKIIVFFKSHTLISPNVTASLRHSVTASQRDVLLMKLWNCETACQCFHLMVRSHSLTVSQSSAFKTCKPIFCHDLRVCKESVDKGVYEMSPPCNEGGGGVAKRDVIDRMFRTVFLVKNRVPAPVPKC